MDQPYAAFAKTLLEPQDYPDLREFPGGPLRIPYDVTAHTLPLMMGVEAVPSAERVTAAMSDPIRAPGHRKRVAGLSGASTPRVGLYDSWDPSMDAGWTRWILDEYGIRYDRLRDSDVRAGSLADRFDAVILPDQSPREIVQGRPEGSIPPRYAGGLGDEGVRELRRFVEAGGTLITFNRSSHLAIDGFGLPVVDQLRDLERREFYVPGSLLRMHVVQGTPVTTGVPSTVAVWAEDALAFEPNDGAGERVQILGRYGTDELLMSGWITGTSRIAGHGALAVVRQGAGRVVLFGFRPQYRGQTVATYPLIFNALSSSADARAAGRAGEPE
jgi:hypothetical protein